jgi:hypothetical protein
VDSGRELLEIGAQRALMLLKESIKGRQVCLASVAGTVRGAKHRDIWDITVVLEYVRSGPPTKKLPRKEPMGRVAFLMMVLVPRRLVEMWRMDVSQEKWAEEGNSVELPTHVLHAAEKAVWCTELGKLYPQLSLISREVKALLGKAGIDRHFPAYSGNSDNSYTAPAHHFHPRGNWTGKRIVQEALMEVPEKAEEIIEDNKYRERRRGRGQKRLREQTRPREGKRSWRGSTGRVSSRRKGQSQPQRGRQQEGGRRRTERSLHHWRTKRG